MIEPRNMFLLGAPTSSLLAEGHGMRATNVDLARMRPRGLRVRHVCTGFLHGNREISVVASPWVWGTPGTGKLKHKPRLCCREVVHGRSTVETGELGVTPLEPEEGRDRG